MREFILCLSHLRWSFVWQRPHHLLSRCARDHRVVFLEEPVFDTPEPWLEQITTECGVIVATPHLSPDTPPHLVERHQRVMVDRLLAASAERPPVLWYYTPIPVAFTHHIRPRAVVYDCMDELSLFAGAPPALAERERLLFQHADVVFTGGHSLYEHKRRTTRHANLHAFPSSVDVAHFARARQALPERDDQAGIARPRVGYFGVIDERLDYALLAGLAELRPDLQFVMIGPVTKVDPAALPRRANLHWLGSKQYEQLPDYIAGWDVAFLPFARSDATRFISPTKTPEYLAAGRPVVSTSIQDVVHPYGEGGLATIADAAPEMSRAIDQAIAADPVERLARADRFLRQLSWDRTWTAMWAQVERSIATRASRAMGTSSGPRTGLATAQPVLAKREA